MRHICLAFIFLLSLGKGFAENNAEKDCSSHDQKCRVSHMWSENIHNAIQHAESAIKLTQAIENEDIRNAAFNELEDCIKCMKWGLLVNDIKEMCEKTECLYENMDEILAECRNEKVKIEICSQLQICLEQLQEAEKAWENRQG